MKRVGQLMAAVVEPDNLRLAFWKAARGKADRAEVRQYRANLDGELAALRFGLLEGSYPTGHYRRFVVHDPKRRTIHAAAFAERVLHHALMNVCEPAFERMAVADSYACRKGKGQWAAVRRAESFATGATPRIPACKTVMRRRPARAFFVGQAARPAANLPFP